MKTPVETVHQPTCRSWRCGWEWHTDNGSGVCRQPRDGAIHYVGTVDSHAFIEQSCDCGAVTGDVLIQFNQYSVDVYDARGEFAGGITARRMQEREAPYIVADAVACIIKALGHSVRVEENK